MSQINQNTKLPLLVRLCWVALLIEFSKIYYFRFDTSKNRVKELNGGIERTREISNSILEERLQDGLIITDNPESLAKFNVYIIICNLPSD